SRCSGSRDSLLDSIESFNPSRHASDAAKARGARNDETVAHLQLVCPDFLHSPSFDRCKNAVVRSTLKRVHSGRVEHEDGTRIEVLKCVHNSPPTPAMRQRRSFAYLSELVLVGWGGCLKDSFDGFATTFFVDFCSG